MKYWMITEWMPPEELRAWLYTWERRAKTFDAIRFEDRSTGWQAVCREARPGEVVPAEHNLLREYPKAGRVNNC